MQPRAERALVRMQSFGALPTFPSGALADLFGGQPSSSGSSGGGGHHTLAHELLGLPAMSQAFSAKVCCFPSVGCSMTPSRPCCPLEMPPPYVGPGIDGSSSQAVWVWSRPKHCLVVG